MKSKDNLSDASPGTWPKKVVIYTDGASRGNPGACAFGLQVFNANQQKLIFEQSLYLESHNTNNFAEYQGVLQALRLACKNNVEHLTLYSDSELLIRQLKGQYKVKSPVIRPLFFKCQKLLKLISHFELVHIPREKNIGADALANQALNKMGF